MKIGDTEMLLKWAVIGGGVVLAFLVYNKLSSVGKTIGDMGSQAGELGDSTADPGGATFANWYDPTSRVVFFYWLTFPDGNHHLVWNSSVAVDATFSYDNGNYRIGVDKSGGLRAYGV